MVNLFYIKDTYPLNESYDLISCQVYLVRITYDFDDPLIGIRVEVLLRNKDLSISS
jgi:hypothetical protein